MPGENPHTTQLQVLIERLRAGDGAAPNELVCSVCDRLEKLAGKMLRDNPRIQRWVEVDDIVQASLMRLLRSLQTVTPASTRAFFGLASQHIRRELIDLARHFYGPEGLGVHHASQACDNARSDRDIVSDASSVDPSRLAEWTDFHREVDNLPDKEREVFDVLFYQGQTQKEAAQLLNVDVTTVQRRWLSAKANLQKRLRSELPGA